MKCSLFYRTAAILLLLFAVLHTHGFTHTDPRWGVDALVASMRSIHFDALGSSRTYWDFYLGFGYSISALFVFSAVLAWQLASLPAETLARLRGVLWAFALCYAAITAIAWGYLFILPVVFSLIVTLCLAAGAWLAAKR
jgi:hypothetical protein